MATQLSLYNGALALLKERNLSSLSENNEARRALDGAWATALSYCLEQGLWNFAVRTSQFSKNTSYTTTFGYANQFVKPDDFVRLAALSLDDRMQNPYNDYTDEAGAWYADEDTIYVSYISNSASYGADMTRWPSSFVLVVEHYLAWKAGPRIAGVDSEEWEGKLNRKLIDARSKDAMNEPTKFMPVGNWVRARGSNGGGSDRGNRGQLIG